LSSLTQIQRVDILEDAGESLNPDIDIGQIEGAFTMGLGYWLLEHLVFDPKTGALLTDRTWVSNFDFITFHSRLPAYSSNYRSFEEKKLLSISLFPHCQKSLLNYT
jgi:xanthine dehydrogenase molybdopterin-binding subunit B